jgi:hypothetical protein
VVLAIRYDSGPPVGAAHYWASLPSLAQAARGAAEPFVMAGQGVCQYLWIGKHRVVAVTLLV